LFRKSDERRSRARPEHHLQRALEREDLRVEAGRRDDVGQEILDVIEHPSVGERRRHVQDLLLEEELFFVIEDGFVGGHRRYSVRHAVRAATRLGSPSRHPARRPPPQ
jgi:hypothetical protein